MYQVEAARSAGVRFYMPCHILAVFVCSYVLSGEKFLYQSVFNLFSLTYICVDIDFRLFSYQIAEKFNLRHKKRFM